MAIYYSRGVGAILGRCMARVNFEYINPQYMLNCRISDFTESTKKWPNFFSVILNDEKVINVHLTAFRQICYLVCFD